MRDKSPWGPGKGPQKNFEYLFFEAIIGKCVKGPKKLLEKITFEKCEKNGLRILTC